jgi:hypothetical protein
VVSIISIAEKSRHNYYIPICLNLQEVGYYAIVVLGMRNEAAEKIIGGMPKFILKFKKLN